jgi:hypothetical protein
MDLGEINILVKYACERFNTSLSLSLSLSQSMHRIGTQKLVEPASNKVHSKFKKKKNKNKNTAGKGL